MAGGIAPRRPNCLTVLRNSLDGRQEQAEVLESFDDRGCFSANWVEKCTTTLTCRVAAEKRRFFVPARSWTTKLRAKTTSHTKNLEVDAEPACTALTESTVKPAAADKALPVSLLYGSLPLAPLCAAY